MTWHFSLRPFCWGLATGMSTWPPKPPVTVQWSEWRQMNLWHYFTHSPAVSCTWQCPALGTEDEAWPSAGMWARIPQPKRALLPPCRFTHAGTFIGTCSQGQLEWVQPGPHQQSWIRWGFSRSPTSPEWSFRLPLVLRGTWSWIQRVVSMATKNLIFKKRLICTSRYRWQMLCLLNSKKGQP